MADSLEVAATDHLLDVGSGIGGPARYFARRYGCRVTGIDLTAEFCDVARALTRSVGLDGKVDFECGNALAMPFAKGTFDGAYSMNVSMNIADRAGLYREMHRVLKPGGWLMLSELAKGTGGDLDYPTPWAASADASFLSTPENTQRGLVDARIRRRQVAQHARADADLDCRRPGDGRARRETAASRRRADPRRLGQTGDGEYGSRAR